LRSEKASIYKKTLPPSPYLHWGRSEFFVPKSSFPPCVDKRLIGFFFFSLGADFIPHVKDVLVYNLSALRKPEKVKTAQLHIFRRRLLPQKGRSKKRLLPPPCRVRLYQILTGPDSSQQPSSSEGDTKELSDSERMKLRSLDSIPVSQVFCSLIPIS
jgi:hypothetical protein